MGECLDNNEVNIILFTSYDKDNNIIRSGQLTDSIDTISLLDNECYMVFTDIYGNLIDSTTVEENISVSDNPVCFLKNEYNEITCYINSYFDGCKKIIYYNKKDKGNKIELDIASPNIKISDIKTGTYTFCFYNNKDEELATVDVCIYAKNNRINDDISTLKNCLINIDDYQNNLLDEFNKLNNDNNKKNLFDLLIDSYNNNDTETDKISWYKAIFTWQSIYNNRLNALNQNTISQICIKNKLCTRLYIKNLTSVSIYDNSTNELIQNITIDNEDRDYINISLDNGFYKIIGKNNKKIVAVNYLFVPVWSLLYLIWNNIDKTLFSNENEKTDLDILSADFIDFTDEEKELAIIQNEKDPYFPVVSCPLILNDSLSGTLNVTIEDIDYNIIKNVYPVYLVIQETDNIINTDINVERKILINKSSFSINKAEHFILNDQQYFVWVQDSFGNILCNLYLLDFNDYNSFNSYSDKMRSIYINNYINNLQYIFNKEQDNIKDMIIKMANYYTDDNSVNESNLHVYLLNDLRNTINTSNVKRSTYLLFKTMLSMSNKTNSFFDKPVYYKKDMNMMTFAPKNDLYTLEVTKFGANNEVSKDIIKSSIEGAIDYQMDMKNYDYYIFRCIDLKTMYSSGFIFACNINDQNTVGSWELDLDVITYG